MIAFALSLILAALWCWSVAAPSWGKAAGAVLFVVAMALLAREEERETGS